MFPLNNKVLRKAWNVTKVWLRDENLFFGCLKRKLCWVFFLTFFSLFVMWGEKLNHSLANKLFLRYHPLGMFSIHGFWAIMFPVKQTLMLRNAYKWLNKGDRFNNLRLLMEFPSWNFQKSDCKTRLAAKSNSIKSEK